LYIKENVIGEGGPPIFLLWVLLNLIKNIVSWSLLNIIKGFSVSKIFNLTLQFQYEINKIKYEKNWHGYPLPRVNGLNYQISIIRYRQIHLFLVYFMLKLEMGLDRFYVDGSYWWNSWYKNRWTKIKCFFFFFLSKPNISLLN